MTRPKHKRPRPPKDWYPSGKAMPTISGTSGDSVVVHPAHFKALVKAGVIDDKGRML